jgi:transcription termination factor Rho
MYDILQLNEMLVPELKEIAEQLELKGYKKLSKQDLIYKILDHQAVAGGSIEKAVEKPQAPDNGESDEKKEETTKKRRRRPDAKKDNHKSESREPGENREPKENIEPKEPKQESVSGEETAHKQHHNNDKRGDKREHKKK